MSNYSFISDFFNWGEDRKKRLAYGSRERRYQNLMMDEDSLYSYGHWFPLAVHTVYDQYILNSDNESVTTTRHQGLARSSVSNRNKRFCEIPFSVLREAGVEPRELYIVDVSEDKYRTVWEKDKDGNWKEREIHLMGASVVEYQKRYFLSAVDEGAARWGWGYFLSELPVKVEVTVDEAYKVLMPPEVQCIDEMDKVYQRQGEWFFIPIGDTKKTKETVYPLMKGKRFSLPVEKWGMLPGANGREAHHTVRDMVVSPEGRFVCRGTVRHTEGEHKMVNLGEGWWWALPNTAVQSWTASQYGTRVD